MWTRIRDMLCLPVCTIHKCSLTKTSTGRVFCGMCVEINNEQTLNSIQATVDQLQKFVGDQQECGEFRTADDMHTALIHERVLTQQLKNAVVMLMVSGGWGEAEAVNYVDEEFSIERVKTMLGCTQPK